MMRKTVSVELYLEACEHCGALVLPTSMRKQRVWDGGSEVDCKLRDEQLAATGVHWAAKTSAWHHIICEQCEVSGKFLEKCAMCDQDVSSADIEESIGDPPEYLCRHCFENVPAKTWRDKIKALDKAHQWDWD